MAQHQPIRKAASTAGSEIPDKLYFRIGDVAKLCEVPAYVLRFWESEFPQLKPHKGGTGQRLYRKRDVEMALRIKTLLYDEGYTIPGARQVFKSELKHKSPELPLPGGEVAGGNGSAGVDARPLRKLQKELRDLHAMLSRPAAPRTIVRTLHPPVATQTLRKPSLSKTQVRASESREPKLFDLSLFHEELDQMQDQDKNDHEPKQ